MHFFGYAFLALGLFMLAVVPLLVRRLITDPVSLLRPQWKNTVPPGFAVAVGILIVLAALVTGLWAVSFGVRILL